MQMEFKLNNTVGVITMTGNLNAANVDQVRTDFRNWYDANAAVTHVVVDLSQVEMVDSAGLGALIALLKQVDERNGDLKLAGMSKRIRMVFEITRTHRIFDILDTVEEALAAVE